MMRTFAAFILLAPALALADCEEDLAFLARFSSQDPVALARTSAARGDLQFLGIAGSVVRAPGVDTGRCAARRDRVRIIDGTSALACASADAKLQSAVVDFARRYNEVVKSVLDGQEARYSICR
jgi:hypothetical protein